MSPRHVSAGATAEQKQLLQSGIVDVGSDIQEALANPPQGDRPAEGVTGLEEKREQTNDWNEDLKKRATQNGHEATEQHENHVPRFVKDEVHEMHEAVVDFAVGDGRPNKPNPPNQEQEPDQASASDDNWIHVLGHRKENGLSLWRLRVAIGLGTWSHTSFRRCGHSAE